MVKKGLCGNNNVYEVEKILGKRIIRKKVYYLVKWKNYSDSENSWEPENNLNGALKAVAEYNKSETEKEVRKSILIEKEKKLEIVAAKECENKEIKYMVKNRRKTITVTEKELIENGHINKLIDYYYNMIIMRDGILNKAGGNKQTNKK